MKGTEICLYRDDVPSDLEVGFFPCASIDSVTLDGSVNDAHGDCIDKSIDYEHNKIVSDILKEGTFSVEVYLLPTRQDGSGAALLSFFPPSPCACNIPVTFLAVLV